MAYELGEVLPILGPERPRGFMSFIGRATGRLHLIHIRGPGGGVSEAIWSGWGRLNRGVWQGWIGPLDPKVDQSYE